MATSIITLLANVPWDKVITALPAVAEGANRLIGRSRGEARALESTDARADPAVPPAVAAHVERLEQALSALADQQADASELIGSLAQANGAMVARIAWLQKLLFGVAAVAGLALVAALITLLS